MTERHPLSDALNAVEHSPEAQGYEVPVELIRSRSRRRRRARTGGAAGALALVVAGAALVVPNLPSPTPAPATDDRPAPGLCGLTYDELAADDGGPDPWPVGGEVPAGLEIDASSIRQGAHNAWSVSTTFGTTSAVQIDEDDEPSAGETPAPVVSGTPTGARFGTTLTLLRDGVVVAAQTRYLATPYTDKDPFPNAAYETAPFPQTDQVSTTIAPCTPGPLTAGTYDLVATQTMFWSYPEGGSIFVSRTTSDPVPVEVDGPAPAGPTPAPTLPAVCGLTTESLTADDSDTGRTFDVLIDATSTPASGPWSVATRIEASGSPGAVWAAVGWTYGTTVALVQDGTVVAVLEDHEAATREQAARTAVDAEPTKFPIVEDLAGRVISCATGEPGVPPGDYQLLASTTIGWVPETDPELEPSIARATSDPVDVTVPDAAGQPDPLVCGASDGGLRTLADAGPLRVRSDSAPAKHPLGGNASFRVDVTNESDERVRATTGHPEVIVTRDGVVVGGLEATEDIGFDVDLDAGESQTFDANSLMTACAGAHPGGSLPAGEYELWAVTTFTPHTGDGPDPGAAWTTAGGPWPLTVVGDDGFVPTNIWSRPSCGDTTDDLANRAASTAQGAVTLQVTQWANPDRDGRLAQVDGAIALTNGGDEPIEVNYVGLVAARHGFVVSRGLVYAAYRPELWVTIAPGETMTLPRPSEYGDIFGCDRDGLPSDELDVWVQVETDAGALVAGPHTLKAID
ncbi:hypothetical protein KIN34_07710 [Cellulomonas sp. DKR-3]|uniref:Uncharacterized protein n=1 Tax=Cellulomonas fulva TaxID=2835530 RepID=A0ABS5TYE3_9CELL|nr:hypothetical protein [Cellulomonas fulva]MBT0994169.1 hypothetical protein [Cellulomonas fulva]